MRAIRHHTFGGPDVLVEEELPTPEPEPGHVLLRVHAAALNHFDVLSRRGIFPDLPLPRIVGIDCTGFVERYDGPRADLRPGTPVVVLGERMGNGGPGAYATHVCIEDEEVFPVPDGVDLVAAACLGISYLTAFYALRRGGVKPGDTLLVPGVGGGVGGAALQLGRALGARVIGTSRGEEKCARARGLGAEACVDYATDDVPAAVRALTGGAGVDFVVNAVGGDTITEGLRCLRTDGTLLTIGTAYGRDFRFDGFDFLYRELRLVGVNITWRTPAERYAMFVEVCELIRSGRLTVPVDRELPLSDAVAAHRLLESHAHFGKIVLRP